MKNATKLLRQARVAADSTESWADLSNLLFNAVDGLVTRAYPKRADREALFATEQYKQIREFLTASIAKHGLVEGATPKKSGRFVVWLPGSLHLALEQEAVREGVSLNQLVLAKLASQLNTLSGQPMAYILQAFLEVRNGFSADRVIADPETDRMFLNRCRELGLAGTDFQLNWKLFNARKDGHLANLPETKKYTVSSERRDEFEFASEIAARYIQQKHDTKSLDKIICDPDLALEFDEAAGRLAPGFSPLEYRWVALGLRKAHRLTPETRDAGFPEFALLGPTRSVDLARIPDSEGVYLFRNGDQAVFVGETSNLRNRVAKHFSAAGPVGMPDWLYTGPDIQLGIRTLPGVSRTARKAIELKAIQELKPLFNILEQAA